MTDRITLYPINGPRTHEPREVRGGLGTMADIRDDDGTWILYDGLDAVRWRETGEVRDGMVVVLEIAREPFTGVY